MNRVNDQKKALIISTCVILGISVLILVLFVIHVIEVKEYNSEWREIASGSSSTQAVVDIHPRGGATDCWVKTDKGISTNLNGKIYEMIVTNNAHTDIEDWYIRLNINNKCYLNNGWCGKFEIHQYDANGKELSQLVDLRNFNYDDLSIRHHQGGQDLLIPLEPGDYVIYYPDSSEASGEKPIKGAEGIASSSIIGFIMYSSGLDVDFNDYELSYKLHKTLWDGTKGAFFVIMLPLLVLSYFLIAVVIYVSVHFENKFKKQNAMLKDVFKVCCEMADSRDFYSKEHSQRVAEYSRLIAEKMGMDKSDCELVYWAAAFHNVGNVFVSGRILRKSGKLTRAEYEEVKKHTIRGAEFLKDMNNLPNAAQAALYHHERYDGTGYPHGKKGEEIPLIARIVAVADAYDAMSNDRPYRKKLMHDQIREELIKNRGTQFDPEVVMAFLDIMGERNL